uniref:NADH-ubiquinone oxidoreductase chain 2 n=1 Tax=Micrura bella TaxID=1692167 RepID=A0A0U2EZG7_9BILA|nr:NADH dehydrogenase subunit 2 [Micrura bella]AKT74027.1 NADH dehydrogenase subunit 2 [Micrura bella]
MLLGFPFTLGFGVLCVVGSLMSLSAFHWLGIWFGLELNLLGFIPLLVQGGLDQQVESSVKYFIVQALGSSFLLVGGFAQGVFYNLWGVGGVLFVLLLGLFLKLGVAPFHWWVPSVMGGLSWVSCGLLATWQKLAPLFLLFSFCGSFFYFFFCFACVSALVGGVGGVGQVQLRILMAYSSIAHLGWMMGLASCSVLGSFCYYLYYFFLSVFVFFGLGQSGVLRFSHVGYSTGLFVLIGLVSLGGLPPFSGFVPKWVGLQIVSGLELYYLAVFLVVGSVISLYYYFSLAFMLFISRFVSYKFSFGFFSVSYIMSVGVVVFCLGFPLYEFFFTVL